MTRKGSWQTFNIPKGYNKKTKIRVTKDDNKNNKESNSMKPI